MLRQQAKQYTHNCSEGPHTCIDRPAISTGQIARGEKRLGREED